MRAAILAMLCWAAGAAGGAWYWPFGGGEGDTNAPPRLHRLLEPANEYIDIAEEHALDGEADKALENYRLALAELDRVEKENPERAETPEFAPLRNRRAVCTAAIDSIRFAQINDNTRLMTVTDTTELQKKWNRKHGIKTMEDIRAEQAAAEKKRKEAEKLAESEAATKRRAEQEAAAAAKAAAEKKTEEEKRKAEAETAIAEAARAVEEKRRKAEQAERAERATVKEQLRRVPEDAKARVEAALKTGTLKERKTLAIERLKAKDYTGADLLLESALAEEPENLNALLLRSAAQAGLESNYAARRTLEKAMRAHPGSYLPYYNLASLTIKMGGPKVTARQYYEMGRRTGGPVSEALEAMVK